MTVYLWKPSTITALDLLRTTTMLRHWESKLFSLGSDGVVASAEALGKLFGWDPSVVSEEIQLT